MKKLTACIAILLTASCTSMEPVHFSTESASLYTKATISAKRDVAYVSIGNKGKYDVYCPLVTTRVIYDDPDSYLEQGEQVFQDVSVFLRAGENRERQIDTSGFRNSHIRNAVTVETGPGCRKATLADFCNFGVRDNIEAELIVWLQQTYRSKTCSGLDINLSGKKIHFYQKQKLALRPLIYLNSVSSLEFPPGTYVLRDAVNDQRSIYEQKS